MLTGKFSYLRPSLCVTTGPSSHQTRRPLTFLVGRLRMQFISEQGKKAHISDDLQLIRFLVTTTDTPAAVLSPPPASHVSHFDAQHDDPLASRWRDIESSLQG